MENALAIREMQQLPQTLDERKRATDLTIDTATHWAKRLMEVVEKCGLARSMGGKKYLEVEGWLLISEFAHCRAVVEWTRPWKDDATGDLLGYEARCQLFDEMGNVVGAGESSCGLDAFPCKGKSGSEKDKASRSAAQTWAISRALRNKFSFVAKIAGYQAVPAEEMPRDEVNSKVPPKAATPAKTAKTALGEAILGYVNDDRKSAAEILTKLTGKSSLRDLTEQQAGVAMEKFEKDFLDDIPNFPAGFVDEREPGADG